MCRYCNKNIVKKLYEEHVPTCKREKETRELRENAIKDDNKFQIMHNSGLKEKQKEIIKEKDKEKEKEKDKELEKKQISPQRLDPLPQKVKDDSTNKIIKINKESKDNFNPATVINIYTISI